MKSTLHFGLEKCIYKKYLNFDFFHLNRTRNIDEDVQIKSDTAVQLISSLVVLLRLPRCQF